MIMFSIPASLKHGIVVGIGLSIAFIGLQWGGIVVSAHATYVKMGDLCSPAALITIS
jgi:AGZA family xanthine/uracil permease-like MFS transporter